MARRTTKFIGIDEAASLFGTSTHKILEYKSKGLLKAADTADTKDVFDMAEVVLLKYLIGEMRVSAGLSIEKVSRRIDQMMGRVA
jgi:DNA-binding transcriptional MerR regulator